MECRNEDEAQNDCINASLALSPHASDESEPLLARLTLHAFVAHVRRSILLILTSSLLHYSLEARYGRLLASFPFHGVCAVAGCLDGQRGLGYRVAANQVWRDKTWWVCRTA